MTANALTRGVNAGGSTVRRTEGRVARRNRLL